MIGGSAMARCAPQSSARLNRALRRQTQSCCRRGRPRCLSSIAWPLSESPAPKSRNRLDEEEKARRRRDRWHYQATHGGAEVEWLQQHLRRHIVREMALRERPEAGAECLIVAALKSRIRMASEEDMLERVECVLSIDLTDPPPERAQHGSAARALAFAIAQEKAVEVLIVAHLVSADLRGDLAQHRLRAQF